MVSTDRHEVLRTRSVETSYPRSNRAFGLDELYQVREVHILVENG